MNLIKQVSWIGSGFFGKYNVLFFFSKISGFHVSETKTLTVLYYRIRPSDYLKYGIWSVMNPNLMTCYKDFIWLFSWQTNRSIYKGGRFDSTGVNFTIFYVFNEHNFNDKWNDDYASFKIFNDNIFFTFIIFLFNGYFLISNILNT